jgi:hypothetical protein
MDNVSCPFCGQVMESQLKFCMGCGRAISEDDLRRSSLKVSKSHRSVESSHADISRKDFTFHRRSRTLMLTVSTALAIFICYYIAMKYMLHEHMPGNLDVKIEQLVNGDQKSE